MKEFEEGIIQMCPEYKCHRRENCYRYRAIPMGQKQSYMINRGYLGDECNKFIEIDELQPLSKDSLAKIDDINREILKKWVGLEYND